MFENRFRAIPFRGAGDGNRTRTISWRSEPGWVSWWRDMCGRQPVRGERVLRRTACAGDWGSAVHAAGRRSLSPGTGDGQEPGPVRYGGGLVSVGGQCERGAPVSGQSPPAADLRVDGMTVGRPDLRLSDAAGRPSSSAPRSARKDGEADEFLVVAAGARVLLEQVPVVV